MRILIVSPVPTHPPIEGNRACILGCSTALTEMGHEVDLLYVHRPWADDPRGLVETAAAWGDRFHAYAATPADRIRQSLEYRVLVPLLGRHTFSGLCPIGLASAIETLRERHRFDAILVNYWPLAAAVRRAARARRVLFTHDLFADRQARTGSPWLSTNAATETRALDSVDAVLAIQADEAEVFRKRTTTRVYTCYSYSTVTAIPHGPARKLLFLAGTNPANVEGIEWFAREVMPTLRARDRDVRLIIGGGVCGKLAATFPIDGISLQPEIDDLAAFYAQGSIVVSPVRIGSGLKIKALEAMSFGRSVLCDPHCLTGIHDPAHAPLVCCTTADDYLREIVARIESPEKCRSDGEAGIAYVRQLNAVFREAMSRALAQ